MARTTGSDGEKTEAALREAALTLMARHGYEAVTMRQLAAGIGVQAAALYRYSRDGVASIPRRISPASC